MRQHFSEKVAALGYRSSQAVITIPKQIVDKNTKRPLKCLKLLLSNKTFKKRG